MARRLQRRPNIEPTLFQCLVVAGQERSWWRTASKVLYVDLHSSDVGPVARASLIPLLPSACHGDRTLQWIWTHSWLNVIPSLRAGLPSHKILSAPTALGSTHVGPAFRAFWPQSHGVYLSDIYVWRMRFVLSLFSILTFMMLYRRTTTPATRTLYYNQSCTSEHLRPIYLDLWKSIPVC